MLAVTAAEKYVAAAYGIVFLVVLVYVLIIALKLGRLERERGETEILGQVRAAYALGTPGPLLDRLFREALRVGRKVRAQTPVGDPAASAASAAAVLAERVLGDLTGRQVLLIGAGEIGEATAGRLIARGARIAFVANRGEERRARGARGLDAEPLAGADLGGGLGEGGAGV